MYYQSLQLIKGALIKALEDIFTYSNRELSLTLSGVNLLTDVNNCIESSTAIGYLMEEYITTSLVEYTRGSTFEVKKIDRRNTSSNNCSYDCYLVCNGIFVMINLKVEKSNTHNSAVSAINILTKNYNDIPAPKAYLVLKVKYHIKHNIVIDDIDAYFLEELNLNTHKQDYRSWGKEVNKNSGRLMVSQKFRKTNIQSPEYVSCISTQEQLNNIYKSNLS